MTITADEMIDAMGTPFGKFLDAQSITPALLARKLKAELNAKVSKTIKVKGSPNNLPRGYKNITTTGIIESIRVDGDVEKDYCDGESVLGWVEVDWGTRQKARIDAHKLRGDYPAEKRELTGRNGGPVEIKEIPLVFVQAPERRGDE